ncbi:MAG: hypothetical protein HY744_32495 [Deltaproteobacteria bacterium]|nr:hypothetical protein [Deltaproteobacteria bacterium]
MIRAALDRRGVGEIAIVGKARPDTLTRELAVGLAALGVIRLYVGVENASAAGSEHFGRGVQQRAVAGALDACCSAGIFCCYNLLLFEPLARLEDVRENVRFVREHTELPVNFCRAEPYYGTPLQLEQARQGRLGGSFLGYNYRIADDRAELLFRVCAAAFRERNFASDGVANRYMGIGYAAKVLERFYRGDGRVPALATRARLLTRAITLDTAELLDRAIGVAESTSPGDWDAIERATALLGLQVAAADRHWHGELDALAADMNRVPCGPDEEVERRGAGAGRGRRGRGLAVGASLAVALAGCGKARVDDVGPGMTVDPVPPDGGYGGQGAWVADPVPDDAGQGGQGAWVADPPPPDAGDAGHGGAGGHGGHGGQGGWIDDPPPPDAGQAWAGAGADGLLAAVAAPAHDGGASPAGRWADTSPAGLVRTCDLPLFDPPAIELVARREADVVLVEVVGGGTALSARWEADGPVLADGPRATWRPASDDDRIRVAVRTRGGVAVKSLRAGAVAI